MSENRQEYLDRLKKKIEEWNSEISRLVEKAGEVKEEKKAEYKEHMETISKNREKLEEKMADLKQASESSWEALKYGVESSWEALKAKYSEAKSKFKQDIEEKEKK